MQEKQEEKLFCWICKERLPGEKIVAMIKCDNIKGSLEDQLELEMSEIVISVRGTKEEIRDSFKMCHRECFSATAGSDFNFE